MKAFMGDLDVRDQWVQRAIATYVHPENVARDPGKWADHFNRKYARLQVLHAVKRGELVKPSHCSDPLSRMVVC